MKKYILIILVGFSLNLNAQGLSLQYCSGQTDGFFSSERYTEYREEQWAGDMPLLPGMHGSDFDYDANEVPSGTGLLLTGLGLAYGMRRKMKN